jgi:hypothetical protein
MDEAHDDYDEAIRQINRSGTRWLLVGVCVLLLGVGGFIWLVTLKPNYDNVTCNGRPMEPGDYCTVVSRTATTTRAGTTPGDTAAIPYESMAEPDLPGGMPLWICTSLAITGVGLWMVGGTIKGWRSDLRHERDMWVWPGDEEADATGKGPKPAR